MHPAHQGNFGFGNNERRGGTGRFIFHLIWMITILSLLGSVTASYAAGDLSLFGPKTYTRSQGKPAPVTDTFSGCESGNSGVLRLVNGAGKDTRVSSANVLLNGSRIIGEHDLNRNVPSLERTVVLKPGANTLSVTIKSGAGDDDDDDRHDGKESHHEKDSDAKEKKDGHEDERRLSGGASDRKGKDEHHDDHGKGKDDGHHDKDDDHERKHGEDDHRHDPVFLIIEILGLGCDATPPVISNPQPADGALLASARPAISAVYADNSGGSGIDATSVRVTLNNSDITNTCGITASGVTCTLAADLTGGTHTATVSVSDLAKNPAISTWRFTTDTTPPRVTVTSPQGGQHLGNPLITVTGTIDDTAATVTVNGMAATLTGLTFSAAGLPLAEGANTITIIAVDQAGNRSSTSMVVTLDTSLPSVIITAPVDGSYTNIPTVTVGGTISEAPAGVTVNGRTATLTGQTFTLENLPLAEGQNTISAEARDLAGNKGSAIVTVTLDTVNPQIFVAAPADGLLTRNPQLTVSGTISEPLASLTVNGQPVQFNGMAFTATLTLNEGTNSIVLAATDHAGNKGTATINVTLDSTPPVVPVLDALPAITNNPKVTLRGSAEAGSSVSLFADYIKVAETVADQSGLCSFPNITLTEGMNTFTAVSLDLAGNTSQISESVNETLDTKAPAIAIATPSDKAILNTQMVTVSGSIDDPTAAVTVNGLPALNSGGIWTLEGVTLQEGTNSLLVEARDPAGNKGSANVTVVLDTIPPAVTVTAPIDGLYTNITQLTVTGTVNEEVSSVTVNGVAATISTTSPVSSKFTTTLTLIEGANSIVVTAVDKAGNKGSATVTVTLDTIAPQLTVIGPADGALLNNGQITFGGAATEPVVSVLVNGVAAQVGANGGYTLPVTLVEGSNALNVTAIDRAGNRSSSTITVTLDSIAPVAPLLTPLATPTRTAATTVSGQAEPLSTVKLFNNGQQIATLKADAAGLFSIANVTLTEGNNPFTATATDAAGNVSQLSAPLTVVLDTKPPVVTVATPLPGVIVSTSQVTISGTVDEPLSSLTVNGASTPLSNRAFEYIMTLAAGDNSALITAADLAGNVATTTITIQRDSTPPKVVITTPLNGLLTNTPQIQVSGIVDDAEAILTVGGASVSVVNKAFSVDYVLTDGDNIIQVKGVDKAGNEGVASVQVTLDAQPPVVSLTAPATAVAGANVSITINATDNRTLTLAELRANGVPIWSVSPTNSASATETIGYRLSPDLSAGAEVTLQARALDAAGNEGVFTSKIIISQAAAGPGYVQGKVLDDIRGLRMEGATVTVTDSKGATKTATSGSDGGYFFEIPSGEALIKITRPGYTSVERRLAVRPEQKVTVLDARLTKANDTKGLIDATGGVVKSTPFKIQNSSFTIDLTIPVNALAIQADLRITPVSNQGIIGTLPLGWSPLAAADVRLLDPATGSPLDSAALITAVSAKFSMPAISGLATATLTLASYDETAHQWTATGSATPATDGSSATADVLLPGQYAVVIPDSAPNAPQAAQSGQPLAAAALQTLDFSLTATTGKVVPQAALPSAGLKAAGEVVISAKADATQQPLFTSGLLLGGRITEKFDLLSGDKVEPVSYTQDIVLYRQPCITNIRAGAVTALAVGEAELRTTFPVSPSKDYTIVDLLLGKVGIEILPPDTTETGVMVGTDGGRILDADGNILVIPQGALSQTTPVSTKNVAASAAIETDFTLLKTVEVNFTRQTLATSATLSIPAPDGFNPSLQVIVAKGVTVKGVNKLKLVALARQSGLFINSDTTAAGITLPGVTTSGTYYFLQAKGQIGFVTGTVTDASSNPFAGAYVKTDSGSLIDLAENSGKYLLAAPVASFNATATDLYKGDEVTAAGAITAANQIVTLNLTIKMIPPTVTAITPANGTTNVQPSVPVTVTFSKPMDKNSITQATLKLNDSTGTAVSSVITWNAEATIATVYPSDAFKQETTYNVTVAATVKDLQGYQLGQDVVSLFVVRRTTPPAMPAAGAISGTFPDADGYINVTGTQGSAAADNTVLLINDTTGEIQSVTPQSNGSFSGKVRGQLGDEIKVVLMDYSGNQTTISYLTFKSPDGSYLVTAKGGKVEGEGGSLLEIPDGALSGATVIKVTSVQQAGLPSPIQTPGTFLSAFNVDSGGLNFQKEVHLSIPVPAGFDPKTPVFVVKPGEVYNEDGTVEKVYEIIDSTKIINGRITTASPPFDGIMGLGSFIFTAFPEVQLGIASGYAYQEMNGLAGYQEVPSRAAWDELIPGTNTADKMYKYDRPVQGAVVRTPAAWNYVSYTRSSGFYAGFSTLFGNVGAADLEYKLTATHPQTMRRETVTGYLSADGTTSRNIEKLNFKLADKGTIIPDKTAPAIDFGLKLAPGQVASAKLVSGTVTVGSDVQVAISVTDQFMGTANLTVEFKTAEMPTAAQTAVQLDPAGMVPYTPAGPGSPAIFRYSYTPTFAGDLKGSLATNFRPQQVGIYTLTVEAADQAGNRSTKKIELRAVSLGEIPAAVDGPPFVLTVAPGDKSADIRIDTSVQAVFSELVTNVNENTFRLFDKATLQPVPAEVSLAVDGGLVRAILVPRANLVYGREYQIRITTTITDASPNSSADGALLPLYREITATFTTSIPKAYDLSANPFSGGRDVALYTDLDNNRLYSYVTAGDQGWRAVDVTKADMPEVVWPRPDLGIPSTDYKFPAGFVFRGVAVEQQKMLLGMTENITFADGNQYGYLRLYDLSDPKKPVVAGREVLSEAYTGIPGRLAMRGDYAYVSTVGAGLQIVNTRTAIDRQSAGGATDGSAIVGAYDTLTEFGHPNDIALSGATGLILSTNSGYLLTFDVTTPEIPMVQGSSRPDGTWYSRVAMADDYVFTSAEGATGVMNLAVVGGKKSVAGVQEGRLFTLDLSDPAQPRQLAVVKDKDDVEVNVSVMDVSVNKAAGLAFVAGFVTSGGSTVNAIQVIDIKDPYHPRLMSTITQLPDMSAVVPPGGTRSMIPIGSTMALTDLNGWLYLANQPKGVRTIQLVDGPSLPSDCTDCYNQIK